MLPPHNPYDWQRVNPDLFYGRTHLASDLVRRLVNGQSFGITGGRRMGKSTLLRRTEKDLLSYADNAKLGGLLVLPIYIETRILSSGSSSDSLYQGIATLVSEQIKQALGTLGTKPENITAQNFTTYLQAQVNSITDYRAQIIFLFDEVEPIIETDWGGAFFAQWRALLHNMPDLSLYISALFTGASEMFKIARDIGSPLGNILVWRELELFSQDETAKLMREPSGYHWSDSFVRDVFELTGGHPYIIQYVMQLVCAHDVEEASQALGEAKSQFLSEQRILFQSWWDKFDETIHAIYARLVAKVNVGAEPSSLSTKTLIVGFGHGTDRSLSILAHTGVIRIDWETDLVETAGDLFNEWFTRFGTIEVTPTLADQVDLLLKDVERKLRKLLASHLNNKYKPSWLRKRIKKSSAGRWQEILKRAAKPADATLSNDEVLTNSDLGDLFDLMLLGTEWRELSSKFTTLSPDTRKAKSRLEERKDHLVFVRNKLRHVNEEQLSPADLLKAQAFCTELLEALSS